MKARLITILLVALSTATCFSRTIIHTKVTFNRTGIYEMCLKFYDQSHRMVGEFNYEPIVIEN